MKLGIMKQTVIKHGHPRVTKDDLVFPSNICPECGYDIPPSRRTHIDYYDFADSKCFINFKGKRAVFKCPECGCEFKREIIYEKHFDTYYFKHKTSGILAYVLIGTVIGAVIGSLISGIIFALLGWLIPTIIATTTFGLSLIILIISTMMDN